MATQDDLTYGQKKNMTHNLREMERYGEIFLESLETVRRTAPAIMVGLEDSYGVIEKTMHELLSRWAHYQANDEWPDVRPARASARRNNSGEQKENGNGNNGGAQGG